MNAPPRGFAPAAVVDGTFERPLRQMFHTLCTGLAGGMVEESAHVGGLIAYLQSLQSALARRPDGTPGARLRLERGWLGSLAASVERVMFFEADFGERWATEALHWLLESGDQLHVVLSHWVRPKSQSVHVDGRASSCKEPCPQSYSAATLSWSSVRKQSPSPCL